MNNFDFQLDSSRVGYINQPSPRILEHQQRVGLDIYKEGVVSNIRKNEALVRADIVEQKRTESYERRLKLREEAQERQRALVDDLYVDDNGFLLICTKNTSVEATPRIASNMRQPSIILFQHVDFTISPCYMLSCVVGNEKQCVFLASDRLARGNYLVGKLVAIGAYFTIKPTKLKPLLLQLIGKLIECCTDKQIVPDKPGWTKMNSGYTFYSEEDVTWTKIKKLIK